jgi:signal transduction histidine kinase
MTIFQDEKPGIVFNDPKFSLVVQADRKLLEVCIRNVLDNALKYSRLQPRAVEISVEKRKESLARIRVQDFGLGIPENEKEVIFEPFYRVDKARVHETGGYGLGLSLCRKIMEAHGGQISIVATTPDQGSTFVMDFAIQEAKV